MLYYLESSTTKQPHRVVILFWRNTILKRLDNWFPEPRTIVHLYGFAGFQASALKISKVWFSIIVCFHETEDFLVPLKQSVFSEQKIRWFSRTEEAFLEPRITVAHVKQRLFRSGLKTMV